MDDYDDLSEEMQRVCGRWRITGPVATYLGFWRDCRFPECRRARACRGLAPPVPLMEAGSGFPPCVHGDHPRHNAIVDTFKRGCRENDLAERIWGQQRPDR